MLLPVELPVLPSSPDLFVLLKEPLLYSPLAAVELDVFGLVVLVPELVEEVLGLVALVLLVLELLLLGFDEVDDLDEVEDLDELAFGAAITI